MPNYSIHGLALSSPLPIAGLPSASKGPGPADVTLRFASLPPTLREPGATVPIAPAFSNDSGLELRRTVDSNELWLRASDGVEFLITRSGRAVDVHWPAELSFGSAIMWLLGPVLGILLQQRGWTCLHASVVAADGVAVAFAGPAGAGKSTSAAAFARAGYEVLSDDVLALREERGGFWAEPGYSWLRLWGPAVEGLYGSRDAMPLIMDGWERRYLDLEAADSFCEERLPLGAIYVLADRTEASEAPSFRGLAGSAAVTTLTANYYAGRFLGDAEPDHFQRLGRLVSSVPIREVRMPAGWRQLEAVPEAVIADLRAVGGRGVDRQ